MFKSERILSLHLKLENSVHSVFGKYNAWPVRLKVKPSKDEPLFRQWTELKNRELLHPLRQNRLLMLWDRLLTQWTIRNNCCQVKSLKPKITPNSDDCIYGDISESNDYQTPCHLLE